MDTVAFVKQYPARHFSKGETLLRAGELSDTLLAVQTGFVKVSSINPNGSERILWIAGRYDIAPSESLFSTRSNLKFFYTAMSEGTVYVIPKKEFIAYAKQTPALMMEIATSMSTHYDDLMARIDSIEQAGIRDKLLFTLQYLARRFSADDDVNLYELGLVITHQELGAMVGTTRETTSLELQKLRKLNLIDYDRTKFIVYCGRINQLQEE